jgi:hypothetical protein
MADYNPFSYYYYNIIIGIIIDIIHISNINIRKTEKIFTPNNPPKPEKPPFLRQKAEISRLFFTTEKTENTEKRK